MPQSAISLRTITVDPGQFQSIRVDETQKDSSGETCFAQHLLGFPRKDMKFSGDVVPCKLLNPVHIESDTLRSLPTFTLSKQREYLKPSMPTWAPDRHSTEFIFPMIPYAARDNVAYVNLGALMMRCIGDREVSELIIVTTPLLKFMPQYENPFPVEDFALVYVGCIATLPASTAFNVR